MADAALEQTLTGNCDRLRRLHNAPAGAVAGRRAKPGLLFL